MPTKLICKTSKFRIKQKDFTIPVRLNNQETLVDCTINRIIEGVFGKRKNMSTLNRRVMNIKQNKSSKSKKISPLNRCKKINLNQKFEFNFEKSPYSKILKIIAIITLIGYIDYCLCDKTTSTTLIKQVIADGGGVGGHKSDLSKINRGITNVNNNNFDNFNYNFEQRKNSNDFINPKINQNKNYKNNLITVLSENIERQHFKMKPINVFIQHKRPSKFDSGDDDLMSSSDEVIQLSSDHHNNQNSDFKTKSKQSATISNSFINKKQQYNSSKLNLIDANMNYILNMHQHGTQMKPIHVNNQQQQSIKAATSGAGINSNSLNPVKVASNLINHNKMISSLFSYITPLVTGSTKLLNNNNNNNNSSLLLSNNIFNEQLESSKAQQAKNQFETGDDNSTTKFMNSFINPFVARSINNHIFGGLESNRQHQLAFNSIKSSPSLYYKGIPTTVSPLQQTSYLRKPPDFITKISGKNYLSKATTTISPMEHQTMGNNQQSNLIDSLDDLNSSSSLLAELNHHHQTTKDNNSNSFVSNFITGNKAGSRTASNRGASNGVSTSGLQWSSIKGPIRPNQMANNYIQDSFRALLTLSQLPILPGGQISTAPSVLEKVKYNNYNNKNNNNKTTANINNNNQKLFLFSLLSEEQRRRALDELYRYAYIIGTGVRRKRDPLKALASTSLQTQVRPLFNVAGLFGSGGGSLGINKGVPSQRNNQHQTTDINYQQYLKGLKALLTIASEGSKNKAKPRGVIMDMATDPSLVVTVFHLLERASVALPLGFLLMPFVHMIRNPFSGIGMGRILPPRASHRSVDYEELAKRLDVVDKMLSRALRSAHRDSSNTFIG